MGDSLFQTAEKALSPLLGKADAGVKKLETALTVITVLSGVAALVGTINLLRGR